jgi:hypothetical protein
MQVTEAANYARQSKKILLCACFYLCLLLCIFLSTKGAYYGANKQALLGFLSCLLSLADHHPFYLCLLICIFLSTKGAYYGANKQA